MWWSSSRGDGPPRTDLTRGGAILFGGWLLIDGLVLSYMKGMAHPYYCLSVAPAMAGLVAIGGSEAWRLRRTVLGRSALDRNDSRDWRMELVAPRTQRGLDACIAMDDSCSDDRRHRRTSRWR